MQLFGGKIPYEANPTSLGVTFDPTMSYKAQVKKIKEKYSSRLNILKIISHKSWALTEKTRISIYKSLIGSVMDYSSFMSSQLSDTLKKTLQATQNNAMRIIFKMPYDATTESLCNLSALPLVEHRMFELNRRYFESAIQLLNELIIDLANGFKRSFFARPIEKKTLLCDFKTILKIDKPD